jgi:hypothetical protein
MKKIVVFALCLMVLGTAAFALEKVAGGGLLLGGTFQSGSINYTDPNYYFSEAIPIDWTFNRTSFGAFGFFGLSQYLEFNLGFLYKTGEPDITAYGIKITTSDAAEVGYHIESTGSFAFGAYGKYPFPVSDKVVIFPTGGLDIEINFSGDWWTDLWIRAGAGVDYFFTDTIFLRGHFTYGVTVPVGEDKLGPKPGHGLLAKVGVGYMF